MGRKCTHATISTFVSRLSPAVRRLGSVEASIDRTIAGYVIRTCGGSYKGVCVSIGVFNSNGAIAGVHSENHKVRSVGGTHRPLFAALNNSESKLKFSIVRDFSSGMEIASALKGNAAMALCGAVGNGRR